MAADREASATEPISRNICDARNAAQVATKVPAELFFVEPMECRSVEKLPEGDEWQHEIKFDGYRAIAIRQRGRFRPK